MREPRPDESPARSAVLLIEEDEAVRLLLRLSLQLKGLVVLEAIGGHDGVAIYRRDAASIGVVITDVQMAEMDGPLALQLMRETNPGVVCFFMTGSGDPLLWKRLKSLSPAGIFIKPFRVKELTQTIWDKIHAFRVADGQAETPPRCG